MGAPKALPSPGASAPPFARAIHSRTAVVSTPLRADLDLTGTIWGYLQLATWGMSAAHQSGVNMVQDFLALPAFYMLCAQDIGRHPGIPQQHRTTHNLCHLFFQLHMRRKCSHNSGCIGKHIHQWMSVEYWIPQSIRRHNDRHA